MRATPPPGEPAAQAMAPLLAANDEPQDAHRWRMLDVLLPAPLAAIPGASASALATGLASKARGYALAAGGRQVAKANAAMFAGCVGAGASQGGFFLLLDTLAHQLEISPLTAIMAVTAVEAGLNAAGAVWASHRREHAHVAGADDGGPLPRQLCWAQLGCGAVDALQAACLIAGTLGLAARLVPAGPVLFLCVLSRSTQSMIAQITRDSWRGLRPHVATRTGVDHPWRTATAAALESVWHAAALNAAALGGFLSAASLGRGEARAIRYAVSLMTLGTALSSLSKLYFLAEMRRHPELADGSPSTAPAAAEA